ncbi:MAG: hypothetical protein DWH73_01400 [Planctomycetota bacterium]|nr:MAG: hypothetical protein DWH73_01400 [Planctomycetota bacterium]
MTNIFGDRKIRYWIIILVLFGIMYPYRQWLTDEKDRLDLGEATIGKVDTGSFMLKLALLGGARGVAANVLWTRAIELQRIQEWDRMKTTVDLITKLQPHFLAVWTYQAWNLAYNVSVEWDAPEDKYDWIKQGINFVRDGVSKNQKSPDLQWDTAWTYYHKLGFADEAIILRKMFRDDLDEKFKTNPINKSVQNDNFQVGGGWFDSAVNLADSGANRLNTSIESSVEYVDAPTQRKGRAGDLAFRSMPAHAQTRYALSLEKESMKDVPATFGELASAEWNNALLTWRKFGAYIYEAPNDIPLEDKRQVKVKIKIIDGENYQVFENMTKPAYWADEFGKVTEKDAMALAENKKHWTDRWGTQMNYPYWTDRCRAELTSEGVRARQMFYLGTKTYRQADFQAAVKYYRDGLNLWKDLLARHSTYANDELNHKDTGLIVKRYKRAYLQAGLGSELPADTPFLQFLKIAEADTSVDPFDAQEMLPPSSTSGAGAGTGASRAAAVGGRPANAPALKPSTPNVQPLK